MLEITLNQALCNYETEKICGLTFGQDEFQMSMNRVKNEGCNLRVVPIHLTSPGDIYDIIEALKKTKNVSEVVNHHGSNCKHAVRVKINVYPERI